MFIIYKDKHTLIDALIKINKDIFIIFKSGNKNHKEATINKTNILEEQLALVVSFHYKMLVLADYHHLHPPLRNLSNLGKVQSGMHIKHQIDQYIDHISP